MFLADKLNKGTGSPVDAQFNYVTMLLHGDGTNGAQNNTFVDSSTNNYTITRTGNTTQGSFSPYGSNWSNYFNGSSNSLNLGGQTQFAFGTGDFTIEFWTYALTNNGAGNYPSFIDFRGSNAPSPSLAIYNNNGALVFYAAGGDRISSSFTYANTWVHIAVVRISGVTKMYVNGTQVGSSYTDSNNYVVGTGAPYIGQNGVGGGWLDAYLSNVRVVKGTGIYTTTFTPSTAPLTAISGTSLLTCQSNRFIDNSSNNFTITATGTPSVQRFNPFGASTAYSTSVIGGSAYFDGSGDNLKFPANSGLLGSNDFSFEAWVYPITLSSIAVVSMGQSDLGTATGSSYGFYVSPSGDTSDLFVGGTTYSATSPNPKIGAWNHVAYVRTGSTFSTYLNGVRVGTTSVSGSLNNGDTTYPATLGGFSNGPVGRPFNGYIAGYQRIIGSGGYNATSTTITVPTTPPTAVANTNALLNFTNGAIFDNAMTNDLETVGVAQISTSVVKYGTGSISFGSVVGNDNYLLAPATPNLEFGSGDFTIEFWWYPISTARQALYHGSFGVDWSIGIDYSSVSTNQKIGIWASSNGTSWNLINADPSGNGIGTTTLTQNAWNHIAFVRNGTTWMLFVNGNRDLNLTSISGSIVDRSTYRKGINVWWAPSAGVNEASGYMDDFRITKGYARYTANFTPPTAAFPNTGPI